MRRLGVPAFYYAAAGIYLLLRAGSFVYTPVRVTDTKTYEQVARLPFPSLDFFAGQRSFTLPLYYKLVGDDHVRITGQLYFSIAAWIVLATAVALAVENRVLRRVAFAVVLLFSAATEIILWDPLLLSESISLSLTALLFAALIWLIRAPGRWSVAAVLVVALFWAFTRDSNAYLVLLLGVIALGSMPQPRHRPVKAALVAGSVAIFAASAVSASEGGRWYQPLRDILLNRVDADPEMRRSFERDLGSTWKDRDARKVYARYLLTHPGYAFVEPFFGTRAVPFSTPHGASALLDPDLRIYNDNASARIRVLPRAVARAVWLGSLPAILAATALMLAAGLLVARTYGFSLLWAVPLAAIASTYPHGLLVWHLSGLEVDRHALEVAVILRVGILLLLVLSLDAVFQRSNAVARAGSRVREWRTRLRETAEQEPSRST